MQMEWSGGVADIDMVPRTIFSFCVDEGLSAFARIPRFVSCVAGQYRSSGLRFGLHRTAQADSLSKILAALLLSGVLAGVAVPVNATETPADAALQSSYDPLAAAVDLFRSGADAPMLWMRSKDDLDRARALVDRFDAAPSHGLSPSR